MPNLTVYIEDELYVTFLKQTDDRRMSIRKKMIETMKDELGVQ